MMYSVEMFEGVFESVMSVMGAEWWVVFESAELEVAFCEFFGVEEFEAIECAEFWAWYGEMAMEV